MAGIGEAGGFRPFHQFPEGDLSAKMQEPTSIPHFEEGAGQDTSSQMSTPVLPSMQGMKQLQYAGAIVEGVVLTLKAPTALQEARAALGPAMAAVTSALPSGTAAVYFGIAAEAVGITIAGTRYQVLCNEIQERETALAMTGGKDETLKANLEEAYARKRTLEAESSASIVKLGLTAMQQAVIVGTPLVTDAPQVVQALSVVSAGAGMLVGGVGVVLISRAVHVNRETAEKISDERKTAIKQRAEAAGLVKTIWDLRVRNLNKQEEENRVGIVKNSISLVSTILGTLAGAKALLIALGITVGVVATASLVALGIGAAVLGGVGLAIGIGYLIYKNRHAILHAFEMAPKVISENFKSLKIKLLSTQAEGAREEIAYADKKLDPHRYDTRQKSIQTKLDEKAEEKELLVERNKKAGFFEQIGNYLHIFVLRIEIYSLTHGQEQITVKTSDSYREHVRSVRQLSVDELGAVDKKILRVERAREELIEEQKDLQEKYKVYQHLGKFGDGSEKELTELKGIHKVVLEPAAVAELQSIGIQVKHEATADERWDAVIQFATQAVVV